MQADYVLDYDVLSVEQEHRVYLLARIRAKQTATPSQRLPLNLSVVLDRSGSMAGDKLDYVKKAAQFLVQHLGANDHFSLVSYNQDVTVNVPPRTVTEKDRIKQALEKLVAGGTTNLSGGWLQGCQLVAEEKAERQINRVLLLTDGLANQGITDPARLESMARQQRDAGITTTAMGVGLDFNEDLLTRMAVEGGGAFYFIDNPDQTPQIFEEELRDLLAVVGQNLVITFTPNSTVKDAKQLNDYPSEHDAERQWFRLGDLYDNEVKTLVLEMTIPEVANLGTIEVGTLHFAYDEITETAVVHRELEFPIMINVVSAVDFEGRSPNAEVVKSALLLQAARARKTAIRHADKGDFQTASDTLSSVADAIQQANLDDQELQTAHDMLREEAVDMELGAQRYDAYTRKTSTSKIFSVRREKYHDQTVMLQSRLKSSRHAVERNKPAPTRIRWKREELPLPDGVLRIGRAADNDIVMTEPAVSEYHCQITQQGDDFILEDLGSTNGTFANGGMVDRPFRLSVGDVLTVGSWLFMLA
ncbi:MAG: VWA domain-containing protein [Chloroflexi bacterium]|nr:VWA domain-containing protein [Chloroflexota bacterium]